AATQSEGKARQVLGKIQLNYGETIDQVREAVIAKPINGVLVAGAIGFVLGAIWARQR
ncbi:MAG: hypothetical protein QOJ04_691, partial [Caballeronia sp.]|nr:hypothetical protein [Caballeronia sp.]